ncbi:hypothetical protein DSECCO2_460540 [anaerobic digester metagenome]
MKVELTGEKNKHKLLLDGHDINNGVNRVEVDVCAGSVTEVIITVTAISELINDDAVVYIKLGDKKFRVLEVQ